MAQHDKYISPFSTRYASDEMQYIFSDDNKFRTWRRLWVALARAEMKQGLTNITPEMVAELEAHVDDINYEVAIEREKLVRHDVMSHVYAYGQQCPKAAGIIHLGATSCYVGDNTDIIVMRQGLELVRKKLIGVLAKLAKFAEEYKDMPCMAYTHCQPAQPTTVGKRATLWANELVMDLSEIDHRLATLQLRGVKGTTGTQASFMELFKGDADKIRAVDASIAEEMGFDSEAVIPVSGQTYSRKVDAFILNALAGIGQSCMKFATDLRLLANFKEMEEPFEKNQIGSSAMPYKRNPMRCERICALSRYLMVDVLNPSFTTGTQWFERTLDDSANKRVAMLRLPCHRRHPEHHAQRHRRPRGLPEGRAQPPDGRAALHGQREHHDAGRGEGRQPSGAPRASAPARHRRRQAGQGRGSAQRHGGPHRRRPGLWSDQGGDRGGPCAGELCGPRSPAGGGVHCSHPQAHL